MNVHSIRVALSRATTIAIVVAASLIPLVANVSTSGAATGTTTYTCPSGGTLSGTTCDVTTGTTYAATATTSATTYTCPSGGTLSGTICDVTNGGTYAASYEQTGSSPTYGYSCPNGGSSDGAGNCISSYAATATYTCSSGTLEGDGVTCLTSMGNYTATATYTCGSGWSGGGSSSQCYRFISTTQATCTADSGTWLGGGSCETYASGSGPTYSCPSGGTLTDGYGGYTCLTSTSAPATLSYSCPNGGSSDGAGNCTSTYGASYSQTGSSPTYGYACPSGGSLSGTTCTTTSSSTYNATATLGATTYTCTGSDTLSGTTCTSPSSSTYNATATYAATATANDGTVFTATSILSQVAAQTAATAQATAYNSANQTTTTPPIVTTYTANATAIDGTVFTATSTVSQVAAQTAATAQATAHNASTTTYTATAIATDGTVFTATSVVSQADAQSNANDEATFHDTTNATTIVVSPSATNVLRSVPLTATVVVANAPSNAQGTIVATLAGPVSTSSAGCQTTAPSRFASAGKKSYIVTVAGSGSYPIAIAAPSQPGCYAWRATVTYAGGVKANIDASGKSSVFVAVVTLSANRVSIPTSKVLARTVAVATRTQAINQPATSATVTVWNEKALSTKAGTTVIAGHVSSPGSAAGVLSGAAKLKAGSLVYATTSTGKMTTWIVTKIQTVSSIPASLFAGGGAHRLVLLTCAGTYNPTLGHYTTYVIVTARAA
jgi:hypothetical protein